METRQGFTLIEIMVAVSVMGILTAVAIPSFNAARSKSIDSLKKKNVQVLNQAVEMWAMEKFVSDESPIDTGITNYIRGGLEHLNVGGIMVNITNITEKTAGYTFRVQDLY